MPGPPERGVRPGGPAGSELPDQPLIQRLVMSGSPMFGWNAPGPWIRVLVNIGNSCDWSGTIRACCMARVLACPHSDAALEVLVAASAELIRLSIVLLL